MPKINQLNHTSSLSDTDLLAAETSTGTNTRNIAYANLRTQLQNESKSVFALHGEIASDAQVAVAAGDWLATHIRETSGVTTIDDTLTISGAAADAQATGKMIVINGESADSTKVNISTTNTDIELAEMSDVAQVSMYNAYNYLNHTLSSQVVHEGVTFTDLGNGVVSFSGTSNSGGSQIRYYYDLDNLPEWAEPGKKYYVKVSTTNSRVVLAPIFYNTNHDQISSLFFSGDGTFVVPDNATGMQIRVLCYGGTEISGTGYIASAILSADSNESLTLKVDDISEKAPHLYDYNAYNYLGDALYKTGQSSSGTFTWTDLGNGLVSYTGDTSNATQFLYYNNTEQLPNWAECGKTYLVKVKTDDQRVSFNCICYNSSGVSISDSIKYFSDDGEYTIPTNAVGMQIRVFCQEGTTVSGTGYIKSAILNADSNESLTKRVDKLQSGISNDCIEGLRPLFYSGVLLNASGEENLTRTDGCITDFISVNPNEIVYFAYSHNMPQAAAIRRLGVFEYASNTTTTASPASNLMLRREEIMCQDYNEFLPLTVGENTHYIRLRIMHNNPSQINKNVFMMYSTEYFNTIKRTAKIVSCLDDVKNDETIKAGDYIQTLGFHTQGDNGGAFYQVVNALSEGQVVNDSTIIDLDGDGNASRHGHNVAYAIRIFMDEPVTLESLNTEAIVNAPGGSFFTIHEILYENGIRKVTCKDLTLSSGITIGYLKTITTLDDQNREVQTHIIWDFDFEFNKITLTGSGPAIRIDCAKNRYIHGNYIVSTANSYGTGIAMYCTKDHTQRNDIKVRDISVQRYGLYIHPAYGHGISGNRYEIGNMMSYRFGIYIAITGDITENWDADNQKWRYSWEGEEHFWVGNIKAANENGTGIGLTMYIQPMSNVAPSGSTIPSGNQSITGTITGLTFHNLAVEHSDTGIRLGCGEKQTAWDRNSASRAEAGIKSIYIHNLRARESWWTWQFLKTSGFIRDLVINPTSMIRFAPFREVVVQEDPKIYGFLLPPNPAMLNQWDLSVSTSHTAAVVHAGIFPNAYSRNGTSAGRIDCIGYDLKALTRDYGETEVVNGQTVKVPRKILYISQPINKPMVLTDSVDYGDLIADFTNFTDEQLNAYYYTKLYMTKYYIVDESVLGRSITLKLPLNYEESAQGIRFRMPKKVGDNVAELVVSFQKDTETTSIVNTDTVYDHLYELSVYYNVTYPNPAQVEPRDELWTETKVLMDLGPIVT